MGLGIRVGGLMWVQDWRGRHASWCALPCLHAGSGEFRSQAANRVLCMTALVSNCSCHTHPPNKLPRQQRCSQKPSEPTPSSLCFIDLISQSLRLLGSPCHAGHLNACYRLHTGPDGEHRAPRGWSKWPGPVLRPIHVVFSGDLHV